MAGLVLAAALAVPLARFEDLSPQALIAPKSTPVDASRLLSSAKLDAIITDDDHIVTGALTLLTPLPQDPHINRAAKRDLAISTVQKTNPAPARNLFIELTDDDPFSLHRGFSRALPPILARLDFAPPIPLAKPAELVERAVDRMAGLSIRTAQDLERAHACLTQAIYFESRSEPEKGQKAVAQVVLNRVKSGIYPSNICGVIFQNRQKRNRCQFSFACDGTIKRANDQEAWETATRIADDAIAGRYFLQEIGNSTHYHASYVAPRWRHSLHRTQKIGAHIFYAIPGVAINDE